MEDRGIWGFGSQEGHGHGVHSDSHRIGIGSPSHGYLQLVPWLRMHGAIYSLLLCISMLWCLINNDSFFLIRIVVGGVHTGSIGHVGHFWPIVPAPGDCEDREFVE
jgi:hypothetical protein